MHATGNNYAKQNKPVPQIQIRYIFPTCNNIPLEYKSIIYMNDTDILRFSHYLQPLFILLRFFSLFVVLKCFSNGVLILWLQSEMKICHLKNKEWRGRMGNMGSKDGRMGSTTPPLSGIVKYLKMCFPSINKTKHEVSKRSDSWDSGT